MKPKGGRSNPRYWECSGTDFALRSRDFKPEITLLMDSYLNLRWIHFQGSGPVEADMPSPHRRPDIAKERMIPLENNSKKLKKNSLISR